LYSLVNCIMKYNRFIRIWLIAGCVMLFFQIIIGGITRITGSGLSITKWEIVTGTLPPLNEKQWLYEFDLYKQTPQYEKINEGMSMDKFKFIYFWEYFHRLWARVMGLVFLIPFLFFLFKKWLDPNIIKRLSYVIFSAALAAVFGWIMVASGLVDRPWVNAYKLSLHLGIALLTLAFLVWLTFHVYLSDNEHLRLRRFWKSSRIMFMAILIQIFLGAIVSGMRAALYYPTWPDMNGSYIPSLLFDPDMWTWRGIVDYDKDALMPALIHVLHRNWAYVVYGLGLYQLIIVLKYPFRQKIYVNNILLFILLNLQVLLGILVLINSKSAIPVFYGVMHQAIAIFIFIMAIFNLYIFRKPSVRDNGTPASATR